MSNTEFIDTTNNKAEEVVQHFSSGMHFVEELLRENERLRYKLIHLNQEMADLSDKEESPVMNVEEELTRLRALRKMIQSQFENMKRENQDFRSRYETLERQNEIFMNLFVSSCQIHSSLDEEYILLTMQEIALHMVGAEVFSIWMVDQSSGDMEIIAQTDECDQFGGAFPKLEESLLKKLATGQVSYFSHDGKGSRSSEDPLACIPLMMEGKTIGAIVIYKLLMQKNGFTSLDHELLDLLATQAVTALVGARCYNKSDCKMLYLEADGTSLEVA
jgi:hypothetical protein